MIGSLIPVVFAEGEQPEPGMILVSGCAPARFEDTEVGFQVDVRLPTGAGGEHELLFAGDFTLLVHADVPHEFRGASVELAESAVGLRILGMPAGEELDYAWVDTDLLTVLGVAHESDDFRRRLRGFVEERMAEPGVEKSEVWRFESLEDYYAFVALVVAALVFHLFDVDMTSYMMAIYESFDLWWQRREAEVWNDYSPAADKIRADSKEHRRIIQEMINKLLAL